MLIPVLTAMPLSWALMADMVRSGSLYQHNTDSAHAFLPRINVGVAVMTAESPLSLSEARWLRSAASRASRVAVCINKVDTIAAADRSEILAFVQEGVARMVGDCATPLFMTSARREPERGDDQGVAHLRQWLTGQLQQSRFTIASESAARVCRSALELAVSWLALERAVLDAPITEEGDRARRLSAAQDHLARVGREGRALITSQAAALIQNSVDPQLISMRTNLEPRLQALSDVHEWPQEFQTTTDHFGRLMESVLGDSLQLMLVEQGERLQGVVDHFLSEVGGIYQVTIPAALRLADPARFPTVRISIGDDPGAVAMGLRMIRHALPGSLGRGWRERAHHQEAEEAADRLAGRLRHAAVSAVDKALNDWLAWSEAELSSRTKSVSEALRRSGDAAASGEASARAQRDRLSRMEEVLTAVAETVPQPGSVGPGAADAAGR
ncbi:MAG: hypothetical protein ACRENX_04965 [Candidatus Dormibacteria bacterium]